MKVSHSFPRSIFIYFVRLVLIGLLCLYFNVNEDFRGVFHYFHSPVPVILLYTFNRSLKTRDFICRGVRNGGHAINFDSCPKKCRFSCRMEDFSDRSLSAVLFFGEDFSWSFNLTDRNRTSTKQRWIFWSWEAPIHHSEYTQSSLTFNWTMTYRQDSDIVHSYGRTILRNHSSIIRDQQSIDFYLSPKDNRSTFNVSNEFHRRHNRILWFVSNCNARNRRDRFAKEINRTYPIDQFGRCSNSNSNETFESLLTQYKFYLAFENAHCRDYLTEKVFYNSLAHGSIPIVLGPSEENTQQLLPPQSFLHVDRFSNVDRLVKDLKEIAENFSRFSSFHRWRVDYRLVTWKSNYYLDDRFCDLCLKLHNDFSIKIYENFSHWLNQCH